ncbi:MAG TPA: ribbon-helix-helix protein, CopG family [Candidatus Paceibacterota bacterium]|nr:ribbon-helix-helix protein, CopG family [Candidatus Paceibacterota bacterium]HMO82673.1 ribbon-helix-helix protein, CopG family [Candidatus Paceibacterota bacterium]
MITISVTLDTNLTNTLDGLVLAYGSNRSAIMRKALERLAEEEAVNAILRVAGEPTLSGDLGELLTSRK